MAKKYQIAVIGGDGTGPEVAVEAQKVLSASAATNGFVLEYQDFDFNGERYLKTGEALPDSAPQELAQFDAVLLGAIGHPDVKPGFTTMQNDICQRIRDVFERELDAREE